MRFSARFFSAVFLLLLAAISVFSPVVHAQEQNPLNVLMKTDSSVQVNVGTLTQGVVLGLLSSATCLVGGVDFSTTNRQCITYNSQTGLYSYDTKNTGGLLGMAVGGIALTYNPPFDASDYLHYLSANFGIVKSAHAQSGGGIGFDQLSPITSLWLAFRNLAYLLFVIIFIVVGFAVMLRAKIDPRTVMTIENQIPKLIVALILISFSFAIAGLMIDVMWVGVYLVINLFSRLDPSLQAQVGSMTSTVKGDPFSWVGAVAGGVGGPVAFLGLAGQAAGGVKEIVNSIALNIFNSSQFVQFLLFPVSLPITIGCIVGNLAPWAWGNIGPCLAGVYSTIISTIVASVAFLIFAVALIVAIAKLWWSLIKSYTLFLIFTIFGPLVIMSGVIPGWTKTNFEYWLRHIMAYTIVFPTAMGVFLLGKTLMDMYSTHANLAAVPPLLGATGVGTGALAFMGPLLGFAVIMLAPQSLAMVQDALNAPDPKYLASIGQAIGVGAQVYGGLGNKVLHRWTREEDRLKGLDEGWLRKRFLGDRKPGNWWRNFWVGKEIPGFNVNKT